MGKLVLFNIFKQYMCYQPKSKFCKTICPSLPVWIINILLKHLSLQSCEIYVFFKKDKYINPHKHKNRKFEE